MSERYTKLFSLPPDLYAQGSPLIVSAGNLLKDNQTGKVLAQLKIKNISPKAVRAATVTIHPLDTAGRPLDGETTYEYLDLSVRQGEEFGQKTAIPLPNPSTRGFTVEVAETVFEDNSAYEGTDAPWEPLPPATPLTRTLGDAELIKQYQLRFGGPCQVAPWEHKDLWRCACGAWNREDPCCACRKSRDGLFGLDLKSLTADKDARLAKEKADREAKEAAEKVEAERRAAEEKAAAEARVKKIKKLLAILIPAAFFCVAAILLVTKVVIPNMQYSEAKALFDAGQYEEAITAFEAMDGYKDSATQIEAAKKAIAERERLEQEAKAEQDRLAEEARIEADYTAAVELYNSGKYQEAIAAFTALDGYKDSVIQIAACHIAIQDEAYTAAIELYNSGEYEEAKAAFTALNGYKDSVVQIEKCVTAIKDENYDAAIKLYNSGKYEEAIVAFTALNGHKDSTEQIKKCTAAMKSQNYDTAIKLYDAGNRAEAISMFYALDGYKDSNQFLKQYWDNIAVHNTIAADYAHTVALKRDGTVVAIGLNTNGQCNVSGWSDIIAIAAGQRHTVGLKSDGTVIATQYIGDQQMNYGQCDVTTWKDIMAIAAGAGHTVGLKADGTVVATGWNQSNQCDVSSWSNIIAIAANGWHTVGLRADGTVVAVGDNSQGNGQCNVSGWKNIVSIAAGGYFTVGLKADGTVLAVGQNVWGQCDVSGWRDITAITAGGWHTLGLKKDGTVVAIGDTRYGTCDVSNWRNIAAIAAGDRHTIGLKKDGTMVATKYIAYIGDKSHDYAQYNVSDWKDIRVPEK